MARYRALVMQARPHGYAGCCAALRDADLRPEIGRIASPTLVISGTHDPVTTPAHGQAIADVVKGARHVSLEAGHLSNVEAAAAFTDALRGFLR
jgi:3-oxoadipate enol-lactonase